MRAFFSSKLEENLSIISWVMDHESLPTSLEFIRSSEVICEECACGVSACFAGRHFQLKVTLQHGDLQKLLTKSYFDTWWLHNKLTEGISVVGIGEEAYQKHIKWVQLWWMQFSHEGRERGGRERFELWVRSLIAFRLGRRDGSSQILQLNCNDGMFGTEHVGKLSLDGGDSGGGGKR